MGRTEVREQAEVVTAESCTGTAYRLHSKSPTEESKVEMIGNVFGMWLMLGE